MKKNTIDLNKHIWEGWTVNQFIHYLEPEFLRIMSNMSWKKPFSSREELKKWCMDNQPYYKKFIPEVYQYFLNQTNL